MLHAPAQNKAEKYMDDVYETSEPNLKGGKERASKTRHETGKHTHNMNLICFDFSQVQVSSDLDISAQRGKHPFYANCSPSSPFMCGLVRISSNGFSCTIEF